MSESSSVVLHDPHTDDPWVRRGRVPRTPTSSVVPAYCIALQYSDM